MVCFRYIIVNTPHKVDTKDYYYYYYYYYYYANNNNKSTKSFTEERTVSEGLWPTTLSGFVNVCFLSVGILEGQSLRIKSSHIR